MRPPCTSRGGDKPRLTSPYQARPSTDAPCLDNPILLPEGVIPICLSCNCHDYTAKHDADAIDWHDLQAAAKDAGIDPHAAAENILHGCEAMQARKESEVGVEVLKAEPERRYTLGLAYGANLPDVGKAADGFRDFAGPTALEDAAWSFLRKGASVGLHHQDGTEGHGTVVESYIWRGPDWPQPNGYVVKAGDWLVGTVWDEPTWQLIKSGELNGYSPQGSARRRKPSPEALAQLRRS